MLDKLRWKLTAFQTAVVGAIVLGMTLLFLFISEENTRTQAYRSFSEKHSTVSSYLEAEDRVSAFWLHRLGGDPGTCISIRDAGKPLFSLGLSETGKQMEAVMEPVRQRAAQTLGGKTGQCFFPVTGTDGEGYFAGVSLISKNGSVLELVTLYALAEMEQGMARQRYAVLLVAMSAMALLGVFSWVFTGKLLGPIQENQRRQTAFIAAASHELRTPLAAILSAASAMERAEPAQQAQFSAMIQKEGGRMSRLIGDMLTLAGSDSKSWSIQLEAVEPEMLLLDVFEVYEPLIRAKGLELTLQLPDTDIPAVRVDRDRIAQVITILLDNARHYTPAPGSVHLGMSIGQKALRITVSDTGPGVPDGQKKRIFERFYQGEKSRANRAHFGLGLSIAAEIVRRHHGKLWVEDAPGGGAEFILELPLP
ncbi:MAG: HAMP domain-containing sensor histidine kinase [Eubacteriales bacterium]|nr:HAMP domain-containing sensor histidine kinase [Eubacteriales bacterium]